MADEINNLQQNNTATEGDGVLRRSKVSVRKINGTCFCLWDCIDLFPDSVHEPLLKVQECAVYVYIYIILYYIDR